MPAMGQIVWLISSFKRCSDYLFDCLWVFFVLLSTHGYRAVMNFQLLACHTFCDTTHPFIMVISYDPCQSNLLPSVLTVELSRPVLTSKFCRGLDIKTQPSVCGANALTDSPPPGHDVMKIHLNVYMCD